MRKLVVFAALASLALPVLTADAQTRSLPAGQTRVIRVIDGDTIKTNDLRASVRLKGFDAPEIRKSSRSGYRCEQERQLGLQAKAKLQELVSPPHKVVVKHTNDADQYGRRVAVVTIDGRDVKDLLISDGLAKEWDGRGPRPDWCGTPMPSPAPHRRR